MGMLSSLLDKIASNKNNTITKKDISQFEDPLILSVSILMIEVSKSDDNFDESEKLKIISILREKFNLNENQISTVIKIANEKNEDMISLYEWTSIINETYEYKLRVDVIKSLWDVAYADGRIDKYEDYTIRKIADLLYVKHTDFIRTKLN
tara:strand:- start:831 stop:1283 length:453 start_codon:yes stop_codon:yes gene_type:complete